MSLILGKKIINKLYESDKSIIYRAFDGVGQKDIIIKLLKPGCRHPKESARYENEYKILRSLDIENVIKAYSFERYNDSYALILEDTHAVSLDRLFKNECLIPETFFDIAIDIVKTLGSIHGNNIIHKNLNPSNIIYHPVSKQIKIIDFGISSEFLMDNRMAEEIVDIESNVNYIAPEQTGKMDCVIDFRSDFYSLGVTFYQLLCGTLPFTNSDPMEMIHAHFAKRPVDPCRLNHNIPIPVSDIVMKLIEKNPDNRYQYSLSIINDLTRCRHLSTIKGKYFNFSVGSPDFSSELEPCDRLFGRHKEFDKLSSLFREVLKGHKKAAIISGDTGVGKTALVMEFCKKNVLSKSYFIFGKFDQVQKDIPYGTIVNAFSQLIQQVLMEKEPIFNQYKKNLQASLGNSGQIMVDLIPELEFIIGPQPPVIELPVIEAQNRFIYVFHNFIRGFANLKRPVVFFLDDLQWVDASSLNFLQMILFSDDIQYGFFIGAYRDKEIDDSHPWQATINQLKKRDIKTDRIHLSPLDRIGVSQYVSAFLHCPLDKCQKLSELVENKTLGNPFYIKEFLKSAHEKKLLELDHLTGKWKWTLTKMAEMSVSGTIAALVMDRLHHINPKTMDLLKIAACLGNHFYVNTLSLICKMPLNGIYILLDEAVKQGVLIYISTIHTSGEKKHTAVSKHSREVKFLHDRFQNAVYSLIQQNEKAALHWEIGNIILQADPGKENQKDILEIVNHLNLGRIYADTETQRYLLARINLLAAKKTKKAAAYQAAFSFLQTGISVLYPHGPETDRNKSPWRQNYDLCLSLHEEAVETAFLISDYKRMEILAEQIDIHAKKLTDRVKTTEVKIRALYAQNRMREAIALGIPFIKKLGEKLPKQPTMIHIAYELFKIKLFFKKKDIKELGRQPEMTDPEKIAVLRILSSLVLPAFYAMPNLVPLIVFKGIRLSVTYGNTEESPFCFAGYGLIISSVTGDIHTGYQFGELAHDLLDKLNTGKIRARTMATVYGLIKPWKNHLKETLPLLKKAYQSGLEFGDHQYAAVCCSMYCTALFHAGVNLYKTKQKTDTYTELIKTLNQDVVINSILTIKQAVDNITGKSKGPWILKGTAFDYEKTYPLCARSNDKMAMFTADLMSLILCCLFGKNDKAVLFCHRVRKNLNVAKGMPDTAVFNFFESLAFLADMKNPGGKIKRKSMRRVAANQKQMKKWSRFAPMNFEHLFYLIEAEKFSLKQDGENAKRFYDLAIRLANKNDYINFEAIANELAGNFFLKCGDLNTAKDYILLAHHSYVRWGALNKSADMEKKYALFFQKDIFQNTDSSFKGIDMNAVLKASRAISKTMEHDRLMAKLVRLVIEHSGAQKACLLLYSDKILKIEAIATTDPDKIEILNSIAVDSKNRDFPTSILYYSVRARQRVILANASEKNKFSSDIYLLKNKPLSILCTPLVSKNFVKGVLYLENNLLSNAFSESHLTILNILTSQILISIENSQLYEALLKEIKKKDKAVKEIKAKQALLKNISTELATAEERERKSIAEDLHDSVSQTIAFSISRLKSLDIADVDRTTDHITEVVDYLNQAANNISSLTFQLSPPMLKDLGFEDTLEWLCEDIFIRHGLKIVLINTMPKPIYLDETIKLTLYRVIRELALNIVKHARVKTAEMTIFSEKNYFFVVLKDNGAGFDVKISHDQSNRFGLFSVYRRMEAINGDIEIISEKAKGTKITTKVAYYP